MSKGLNTVTLLGHVGADPEIRYAENGNAVANMRLATSEQWRDKKGNKQESTEWHKLVVFGKLAEIVSEYVSKGTQILVVGSLRTRKWQDKTGQDRYTTEVNVRDLLLLGRGEPQSGGKSASRPPSNRQSDEDFSDPDDDIPF